MPSSLHRLIYISTAKDHLGTTDIADILNTSINNNNQRRVTGFLLHNGPNFLQVLEGSAEEVIHTYAQIIKDDRHHSVTQIVGEDIVDRAFERWDMNYYRAEMSDLVSRRDEAISDMLPETTPPWLTELLERFARIK